MSNHRSNLDAKVCAALRARADALRLEREVARDAEMARAAEAASLAASVPISTPPQSAPLLQIVPLPTVPQSTVVTSTTDSPVDSNTEVPFRHASVRVTENADSSSRPVYAIDVRPTVQNNHLRASRDIERGQQSSEEQSTLSSSPENLGTRQLPRSDPYWFDTLFRVFDEFRRVYGESTWYRVLCLILNAALVIGVFLLVGSVIFLAIRGRPLPDASTPSNVLSPKSLCLILNLTLPICTGDGVAPGAKTTGRDTEVFDLSDLSEHYKFHNFLLVQNPLTRVCAIFPGLNPHTRRFTVLSFEGIKELLIDSESAKFQELCDLEKIYKVVKP